MVNRRMKNRSRTRVLSIFSATAILAIVVVTVGGMPAAAKPGRATTGQATSGVKFVLQYHANLSATWHNTTAVNQARCSGDDSSGSLTSSVGPGPRRYTLVLSKPFGSLQMTWQDALQQGKVNSNRTAQGWMMAVKDHKCQQVPLPEPSCGGHSFSGPVVLRSVMGSRKLDPSVYLEWQIEPSGSEIGCDKGEVFDFNREGIGQSYARLFYEKLYRCGLRKPRTCKLKIGGSRDFPHHVTQGDATYDSSVHTDWSVTFVRVKK